MVKTRSGKKDIDAKGKKNPDAKTKSSRKRDADASGTRDIDAKPRSGKINIDEYKINGTNKIVRVGDSVLMLPPDTNDKPYVAQVEKLEEDDNNNVYVSVRWYYRPEDTVTGRRKFHGEDEIFLSDHRDVQSARTIEGKCVVHSYDYYLNLENVGVEDYYCRMEYNYITGVFTPERINVYCKCQIPYNPDVFMVQCEDCDDWFHPACVGTTIEDVKRLDHFQCPECLAYYNDSMNKSHDTVSTSPTSDGNQ